jgi:hypothetical protein
VYRRFDRKEAGIMKTYLQTQFTESQMPGTPTLMNVDDA